MPGREKGNPERGGGQTHWSVKAVVLLGLLLTAFMFLKARQMELDAFDMRLEDDSDMRVEAIRNKLGQSLLAMEVLRHFFEGEDLPAGVRDASRPGLPFADEHPEIMAVEWVPRGSQEHLETLELARDTGKPAVSPGIQLAGSGAGGFIVAGPIYRRDMPVATVDQRRSAIRGYIRVVFRTDLLLFAVLKDTEALGLGFDLLDLSAPPEGRLLHHWSPRLTEPATPDLLPYPPPPRLVRKFAFAGREWAISLSPNRAYMARNYPRFYWVLLPFGVLLTGLLALYLRRVFSQRSQLERLVAERTAHLRQLSAAVQQSPLAIVITGLDGTIEFVNPKFSQLTGYSEEEAVGRNPRILKSGDTPPESYRALWETVLSGGIWEGEFLNRKKNGELFREHATISPVRDGEGAIAKFMAIKEDITEQKRMKETLRATKERLRDLVGHQRTVLEEERTRIAREIHDELGQQLTVLGMELYGIDRQLGPGDAELAGRVRSMLGLVQETHGVVQRIIRELRPQVLDDLGFPAAVEWLAAQLRASSGIPIDVDVPRTLSVSREIATAGFRITQEALSNVMRHAGASRAWIRVKEKNGILYLRVGDDGRGMDPDEASRKGAHGLLGIQERARLSGGKMKIRRRRNGGTELVLLLPMRRGQGEEGKSG